MGEVSKIEWCDSTWNPWYGCQKISPGCKNCYMYRDMARTPFDPFTVTKAKSATFNNPLKWKEPKIVFTCSWSDFWIEQSDPWRAEAMRIIRDTPHHIYQVLTKRPERIPGWLQNARWPDTGEIIGINGLPENVWLGVSVESQEQAPRIWHLCQVPAKVRFVSAEPLLGMVDLGLDAILADPKGHPTGPRMKELIHWVISGGESGPANKIRKAETRWFQYLRDQCAEAGVKFFHKQNGGSRKINGAWGGRELDGRTWDEMPI